MFLKTDGAGNLSFDSLSFATPLAVIGNATAGSEIRLPEDTDNGSNYVAIKAPDTLASNLTLTLPSADGTSGQVLQTNGSGVLSFAGVSASAGQIIQVVQGTTTTSTSTSSGSFTDVLDGASTWETSITPTKAGNKILVMPTIKIGAGFGVNSEQRGTIITQMKIGAGSYADFIAEGAQNTGSYDYGGGGVGVYVFYGLTKLYTTSSTSAHTFKFRIKVSGGTTAVNQGAGDVPAFITLFEIAT